MNAVRRISWFAAVAVAAAFGIGLALFAQAGTFSRYWADDYCYSAWVQHYGLTGAVADWYQTSGNRLSTLAAVALAELFGHRAIAFVPGAVLVLWVGAWIFALPRLQQVIRWNVPLLWTAAAAVMMVYFSVLLAPDRLQSVYWRMGTLHYTLPAPLLLFNLGILGQGLAENRRGWAWAAAACGLLAFFTAGLSETAGALQAALFGLLLGGWVLFYRETGSIDRRGLALFAAPLLGTLLMMLIQMQAPANAWRQAAMPPPENLLLIIPVSLRYAADFIFFAVRGQIVPFAVFAVAFGSLALLTLDLQERKVSLRLAALGIFASLVAAYLLVAGSFAPSAYAGLQYPAGRAQMPGHFAMLAGLAGAAVFGALLTRSLFARSEGLLRAAALILLLLACLYPLRAAPLAQADAARLAAWAERWDDRDAQIRRNAETGAVAVTVRQVEVVQSLEDIGPDSTHWINACAALYYGAASITAQP